MPLAIDPPNLTECTPERILEWMEELEELRDEMADDPQALEVIERLALLADEEMEAAIMRLKRDVQARL